MKSKKAAIDIIGDLVIAAIIIIVGIIVLSVLMHSLTMSDRVITSTSNLANAIGNVDQAPFTRCIIIEDVVATPKKFIVFAPQEPAAYVLNDKTAFKISKSSLIITNESAIVERIGFRYPTQAIRHNDLIHTTETFKIKPYNLCCPSEQNDKDNKCTTTCNTPLILGLEKEFDSDICVCVPYWLNRLTDNPTHIEIYPKGGEGCI